MKRKRRIIEDHTLYCEDTINTRFPLINIVGYKWKSIPSPEIKVKFGKPCLPEKVFGTITIDYIALDEN